MPAGTRWGGRTPSPISTTDRFRIDRNRIFAEILDHRLKALGWWRDIIREHPGGVVPVRTAARILGVTRQRLWFLIAAKRITTVGPFPGSGDNEVFIPLDDLLHAPTPLDKGRPVGIPPDIEREIEESRPPPPKIPKYLPDKALRSI